MISQKITNIQKLLDVLADPATVSEVPKGLIKLAARQLRDCAANVREMEEQVVPRRQRLSDEHLASGKVHILGIIPRNEAFL